MLKYIIEVYYVHRGTLCNSFFFIILSVEGRSERDRGRDSGLCPACFYMSYTNTAGQDSFNMHTNGKI